MNDARRATTTLTAGVLALLVGSARSPGMLDHERASTADRAARTALRTTARTGIDCGGVCPAQCTGAVARADDRVRERQAARATRAPRPRARPAASALPSRTCNDGEACELDKDCKSGFCDGAKCATPASGEPFRRQEERRRDGHRLRRHGEGDGALSRRPGLRRQHRLRRHLHRRALRPDRPDRRQEEQRRDGRRLRRPERAEVRRRQDVRGQRRLRRRLLPGDEEVHAAALRRRREERHRDGRRLRRQPGGPGFKKCAEGHDCLADTDCIGACKTMGAAKKCIDAPSCKPHFGGDTCGTNEPGGPRATSALGGQAGTRAAAGRSRSTATPIPIMPAGKTKVYLDKYEITAGRMRAFLDAMAAASTPRATRSPPTSELDGRAPAEPLEQRLGEGASDRERPARRRRSHHERDRRTCSTRARTST